MALSPAHVREVCRPRPAAEEQKGRSAFALLWSLLVLLLIAAPAWWWIRHSEEQNSIIDNTPAAPVTSEVLPAPVQQKQPSMVKQP